MALLLKSKDIILRRTCTMPLIGQENPKRLDIDCGCDRLCREFGISRKTGYRSPIVISNAVLKASRIEVAVPIATPTNFLFRWRTTS
jgi:hypothetical protein